MKILFATFWDYPHVGGISTHMKTLKAGLEEVGHEVFIFSKSTASMLKTSEQFEHHMYYPVVTDYIHRYNTIRFLFEHVAKEINFDQFDIVHCHDVVAAEIISRLTNKPIITTIHGYLANESLSEKAISKGSIEEKYLLDIEKKGSENSQYLLCVDQKIYHYEQESFNIHMPTSIMKNFVDFSFLENQHDQKNVKKQLGISADTFLLISPRRLVEKNGVIYGVKAMHELIKHVPNALLICFGDGPQRSIIQTYIDDHDLGKYCKLAGNASNEVVAHYLTAADVTLVPSIPSEGVEEATSIAAIEGMAKHTVVIASNIGGLKELIQHNETGLLVEPFDHLQMSRMLTSIYQNAEERNRIQNHAYDYSKEHYSHIQAAKAVTAIYESILS